MDENRSISPALVLSLFPGADLLGHGFSLEGWCVVKGPDPDYGCGDIRSFTPARSFTGIIGGSPCQDFSDARRDAPTGYGLEMIAEFVRCVESAEPEWWLLENVRNVPDVVIGGYSYQRMDVRACEFAAGQSRLRHFQFGHREDKILVLNRPPRQPVTTPAALASEASRPSRRSWSEFVQVQGLPADFNLPLFTKQGKYQAVGNGVPIPLARAIARAIRDNLRDPMWFAVCACGCGREVTGKKIAATDRCRKTLQRRRDRAAITGDRGDTLPPDV